MLEAQYEHQRFRAVLKTSKIEPSIDRGLMLQAQMQNQLDAVQQQLQGTMDERDHAVSELETKLNVLKTEVSSLKVSSCTPQHYRDICIQYKGHVPVVTLSCGFC